MRGGMWWRMRNTLIPGMQPNWRYSLNGMAHCGKRGILTFLWTNCCVAMRRVIPLTVFRKITFVRPGSVFTPRCSARWNQAIRMETCWSVCARTLTFGLFRCAAKQTCMRAISLQRHFVNIGGRIVPSMREGFCRRQRPGGTTRVREVLCCGRDGGDIVRPSRQSRSRTSRVVARAR